MQNRYMQALMRAFHVFYVAGYPLLMAPSKELYSPAHLKVHCFW